MYFSSKKLYLSGKKSVRFVATKASARNVSENDKKPDELKACYLKLETMREFSIEEIDRIIEMAWEDRTPFDVIKLQFGLRQGEVEKLMRKELKFSSFKRWRKRVS